MEKIVIFLQQKEPLLLRSGRVLFDNGEYEINPQINNKLSLIGIAII